MGRANAGCHRMGMSDVTLLWFSWRQESALTLPPAPRACYKCNMRRWMRDRGKRRKQQTEKPTQENPAPLQPKFPEPPLDEGEDRQPDFEARPQDPEMQPESNESPLGAQT